MTEWINERGHGFGISIEVERTLYSHKSEYQQIDIYQTCHYGRMLVLDGVIQLTEFDEAGYQEMLTHVPLCAHPAPEKLLVIGGGDGGVLREAAKHKCLKTIDICEIDKAVIAAAKQYLPSLSRGFDDPRVRLHIGDGAAFVAAHENEYDAVIVDSSDPVGPNTPLFNAEFYRAVKRALRPGGIVASQSESIQLFPSVVSRLCGFCRANFKNAGYYYMIVPSYPGGGIGGCIASDSVDFTRPARTGIPDCRYYSPQVHTAAFVMPEFARKFLEEIK
ncbi:MAG: polyamine aminopropyltransferase [Victivallaceae bacterium]|nr:polyamine aminopropyltransferase [Victivallaceae bacterium]